MSFSLRLLSARFAFGILCLAPLTLVNSVRAAGTYDYLYDFNSNWTLGAANSNQRRITIPRKNGVEVPVIKMVICSYPGSGATGNAGAPHASMSRWAYDNGIAFYSVGYPGSAASETFSDLTTFSGSGYLNRPGLANAPIVVQGGSFGCSTAMDVANTYPSRVIALYGYHKGSASAPIFPQEIPAHVSFGEMDSGYSEYNTSLHWKYLTDWAAQGGAPRSFQFDRESAHTEIVDRPSHLMLFVDSMIPLRYPYQQGVAGKDPELGSVTLTPVNLANGWRGEHLLTPSQPTAAAAMSLTYALRSKEWESPNLAIAPAAQFDRANPYMHSWFPDAKLAYAWRSRAGLGVRQMKLTFPSLPSSDSQDNTIRPAAFNTDQTADCQLDTGVFTSANRVEFFDNGTRVANDTTYPFANTYSWVPGGEGFHVLYAVAVDDSTGERRVSGCRIVRVTPKLVAANTAPTISTTIPVQTVTVGTTSISIPITVGDAETAAASLGLLYVKESARVDTDPHNEGLVIAHTATFAGAGANRTLNITLTDTATTGTLWSVVQVNDGDLQANVYIRINVVPATAQPPIFVPWRYLNSAYGTLGEVAYNGGWSREMSFRVFDPDTASENLTVTATSNNQSGIPDSNIIVGGYGEYRTLKVKATGSAYTTVTLTVSDGTNSATSQWRPTPVAVSDIAPVLNITPDQSVLVGEPASVMVRPADFFTSSQAIPGFNSLTVTATSNNQALLPDAGISVIPAGYERRIVCQPTAGQTGSASVTVTATDEGGLTATDTFTFTVGAAVTPTVTSQPVSVSLVAGGNIQLSVAATGGNPKTYQWYLGASGDASSPVSGGTTSSLTLNNLSASGSYWVRVTNSAGSANSSAALVSAVHAPSITTHPLSQSIYSGQTATLSVAATGENLTYQWYEGNSGDVSVPVAGATAASFTTPALTTTKKYWVRVGNIAGTADSVAATAAIKARSWVAYHDTITITDGNAANVTAASVATTPGTSTSLKNFSTGSATGVTLNALLTGTKTAKTNGNVTPAAGTDAYKAFNGIISFQNGTTHNSEQLVSSTNSVVFAFSGLDSTARYSVAFYAARNAFTTPNKYTMSGADSFQEGHSSGVGNAGDADAATADVASGTGSTTNGYLVKWVDIAPGADGTFAVQVGTYTGTSAAIIPEAIMLEAFTNTPPAAEISAQPQGSTISYNATASLSVSASGTGLAYQWYRGAAGDISIPLAGAISPSLTTPPLTADASFWARITNAGGVVDSQAAIITVAPQFPTILTSAIEAGIAGDAFQAALSAWGGQGAILWSIVSGQLPSGLTLNATTGAITGTNSAAGSATLVVRATDALGRTADKIVDVVLGKVEWTAYHDTQGNYFDGNAAGTTYGNSANANSGVTLKNLATQTEVPQSLQISSTVGTNGGFKQLVNVDVTVGGDAGAFFNGIVSFGTNQYVDNYYWPGVGVWDLGINGSSSIAIYQLDPAKKYEIALFAARQQYDSRTQYSLGDAGTFTPLHSNGALATSSDGASVAFQTGTGALEAGRVARWTNIVPTGTSPGQPDLRSFKVTVSPQVSGTYPALLPQGIRIRQIGSAQEFTALPCITSHPGGTTINAGQTATLSATVTGAGLSFQWYRGTSGDTSAPVPGANAASFTTPALNATTAYWLRVSNAGGTMDSASATVTVNGPAQTPLEAWAAANGLIGQTAAGSADPEGDGIVNLLEFAFGSNPATPSVASLPSIAMPNAATLDLTFHRASSDLRYIVESSTTLAADSWTPEYTIEKNADPATVGQDVTIEVPLSGATKKFLRLRVEE